MSAGTSVPFWRYSLVRPLVFLLVPRSTGNDHGRNSTGRSAGRVIRQGLPGPAGLPSRRAEEAGRPSIANSINCAFPIGSRVRVSFHDRKVIPGKIRIER